MYHVRPKNTLYIRPGLLWYEPHLGSLYLDRDFSIIIQTEINILLTGEDSSTQWSHNAHEKDGNGHESGHLVLSQCGEGEQSCRHVEDQRRDRCPEKHSIPHLCTDTQLCSHTLLHDNSMFYHTIHMSASSQVRLQALNNLKDPE